MNRVSSFAVVWFLAIAAGPLVAFQSAALATQVAAPSFSIGSGSFTGPISVTITCPTSGSTIRVTTDGSVPTANSTLYAGPLKISTSSTLRAIAIHAGMTNSAVTTANYAIAPPAPVVSPPVASPPGGTYIDSAVVTLQAANGVSILYTIDGTDPATSTTSASYKAPITIDRTRRLRAVARSGSTTSNGVTSDYTIAVAAPTITPSSTAFLHDITVRIAPKDFFSTVVRYTIDGSEPTSSSSIYIDLGLPHLSLNRSTTVKAKGFRDGCSPSSTVTGVFPQATVLFVHGLISDPSTWLSAVRELFPNDSRAISELCPTVTANATSVKVATCYRADFGSRFVDGVTWNNGDGEQLTDLGSDVAGMIGAIMRSARPQLILIAGHSRGGLAARAYLQTNVRSDVVFGLLTIGTPHQGSPLGRVSAFYRTDPTYKLTPSVYSSWQAKVSDLQFVFSPSTATLATDHDAQQRPISTSISAAITSLTNGAGSLTRSTAAFGQINSTGLVLGQNLGPLVVFDRVDLLGDFGLQQIEKNQLLPGKFDPTLKALRAFILKNLSSDWNVGDGAVPDASSDLSRLPNFRGAVNTTTLSRVIHTQETGQTAAIYRQLVALTASVNASGRTWSLAATQPTTVVGLSAQEPSAATLLGELRTELATGGDPRRNAEFLRSRLARSDSDAEQEVETMLRAGGTAEAGYAAAILAGAETTQAAAALLDAAETSRTDGINVIAREELVPVATNVLASEREAMTNLFVSALHREPSPEMRRSLIAAMGRLGTENAVVTLIETYSDSADSRQDALAALLNLRHDDGAPLLGKYLLDRFSPLHTVAGEALSNISSPNATAELLKWAVDTDDTATAVRWLSRTRDSKSLEILKHSVASDSYSNPQMREALRELAAELDREFTPKAPRE